MRATAAHDAKYAQARSDADALLADYAESASGVRTHLLQDGCSRMDALLLCFALYQNMPPAAKSKSQDILHSLLPTHAFIRLECTRTRCTRERAVCFRPATARMLKATPQILRLKR